MNDSRPSKTLSNWLLRVVALLPLLVVLFPGWVDRPLANTSEESLLFLFAVAGLVLAFVPRAFVASHLFLIAFWVVLFSIAQRGYSERAIGNLTAASFFYLLLVFVLSGLGKSKDSSRSKNRFLSTFLCAGLVLGGLFVFFSDLLLIHVQTSALPFNIPRDWTDRMAFLIPMAIGSLGLIFLARDRQISRWSLVLLAVVSLAFGLKERQWSSAIAEELEEATSLIVAGDLQEAEDRLDKVRQWNRIKNIDRIEDSVHLARARLAFAQKDLASAVFQVKKGTATPDEQALEYLSLLDPEQMQRISMVEPTKFKNLDLTVDIEPWRETSKGFIMLDRWGRVFDISEREWAFAFEEQPGGILPDEPADLEVIGDGQGAIVLGKSGRFHLLGNIPSDIEELIEEYRPPAGTYIDFEISPSKQCIYLLTDTGKAVAIGKAEIDLSTEEERWNYSVARDLELSKDGQTLYLLDRLGKVHTIGREVILTSGEGQPYWTSETACDIEIMPSGKGIYLLTIYGEICFVGTAEDRLQYRLPQAMQPMKEWPFARAFQIGSDGQVFTILNSNGGLTQIDRRGRPTGFWLSEIVQSIEEEEYLQAVRQAETALSLPATDRAAVFDLLDATYCRLLHSTEFEKGTMGAAVDVELTSNPSTQIVLDRWGRLWRIEDESMSILKPDSRFSDHTGPATDLEWIASASYALILYDRGEIEIWGEPPEEVLELLANYKPEKEGWIDLELSGDGKAAVLANTYGGFEIIGDVSFQLPALGDFDWFGQRKGKDFEFGENDRSAYFLDENGGLHPFGNAKLFIRDPEIPYWNEARAQGITIGSREDTAYVLDIYGEVFPIGEAAVDVPSQALISKTGSLFIDMEMSPSQEVFAFLRSDFKVTRHLRGDLGVKHYLEQFRKGIENDRYSRFLPALERTVTAFEKEEQQKKFLNVISPEWCLSITERFPLESFDEEQYQSLNYHWPLFTDLESLSEPRRALMLDRYGRIYLFEIEDEEVYLPFDTTPIPDIDQCYAIDLEVISESPPVCLVLDSRGRAYLRGEADTAQLLSLIDEINEDPSEEAIDIEPGPDSASAVVMNRMGFLKSYGEFPVPESELTRFGWPIPIARDIELSPSGQGLYLLDGLGAVHSAGVTEVPTRPGEVESIPWIGEDIVVAMSQPSAEGFWVMDKTARVYPWTQMPYSLEDRPSMPLYSALGERPVDIEVFGDKELMTMSSWGRIDYYRGGEEGARFHFQRAAGENAPLAFLEQIHKAIAADATAALGLMDTKITERLFGLPGSLGTIPDSFWRSIRSDKGSKELFGFILDIQPAPNPQEVYALDRWGRIFLWNVEEQRIVQTIRSEPVRYPTDVPASALAVYRPENGEATGFIVADIEGMLYVTGELPRALGEAIRFHQAGPEATVDLCLTADGEGLYLLGRMGTVVPVGRTRLAKEQLPDDFWDHPIAWALVIEKDETGGYMLDGHGSVHTFGGTQIETKGPGAPWFSTDRARSLEIDPGEQGLYLGIDNGTIFNIDRPRPLIDEEQSPSIYSKRGESLKRIALSPGGDYLWALTTHSKVERIPLGTQVALQKIDQAIGLLGQGDAVRAHRLLIQAQQHAPKETQELMSQFSKEFVDLLLEAPDVECSGIDFWVDFELREDGNTAWLLNRWGEIYETSLDQKSVKRIKSVGSGAQAVDFLCDEASRNALVLYRDGELEIWGEEFEQQFSESVREYNEPPLRFAIDLEWAAGRKGFYVLSSRGALAEVGEGGFQPPEESLWNWEDDIALTLKSQPDGEALYLLDRQGGLHVAGSPSVDLSRRQAPYFVRTDLVKDIEPSNDWSGFYFLDSLGGIHAIGAVNRLPQEGQLPYYGEPGKIVDLEIGSEGRIVILTCSGRLHEAGVGR